MLSLKWRLKPVIVNPSPPILIYSRRKMYDLLTLVDRLDFVCKSKRKSISVTKNLKKKSKKKNLYYG